MENDDLITTNNEDNADIFYQPYIKSTEDALKTSEDADRFYSPYLKTIANYNSLNLQPSLYNTEETADVFYRNYYSASVDSTNNADEYYHPYLTTLLDYSPKEFTRQELPSPSLEQQYQGPVDSALEADEYYQPYLSTLLDYRPREIQRQELPSLAEGQQLQGPVLREYLSVNDMENEIFDVPKVLLKAFRN